MSEAPDLTNQFGDIEAVEQDLLSVRRSDAAFAAKHNDLVQQHPRQWVAFHDGKLVGRAADLESVLNQMDAKKIPRSTVVVEFLDPHPRVLVL